MSAAPNKTGTFKCDDCGKGFDSAQGVAGHRLIHRDTPPCEHCGAEFTTPSQRARHLNSQHGVPLKGKTPKAANGWNADDILEGLVASLWPGGNVPATALGPLFRWREATSDLLESVQSPTQTQT